MRVFVTGQPGVGKTTLIKDIANYLENKKIEFRGFITEEIRERGKRIGFKIVDLKTKEEKVFASVFIESNIKFGRYFLDISSFESIALKIFAGDFLIIDEIGKMEFFSSNFKRLLFDSLRRDINLLASLHREFVEDFKNFGKIYFLTPENRDFIKKKILEEWR